MSRVTRASKFMVIITEAGAALQLPASWCRVIFLQVFFYNIKVLALKRLKRGYSGKALKELHVY